MIFSNETQIVISNKYSSYICTENSWVSIPTRMSWSTWPQCENIRCFVSVTCDIYRSGDTSNNIWKYELWEVYWNARSKFMVSHSKTFWKFSIYILGWNKETNKCCHRLLAAYWRVSNSNWMAVLCHSMIHETVINF